MTAPTEILQMLDEFQHEMREAGTDLASWDRSRQRDGRKHEKEAAAIRERIEAAIAALAAAPAEPPKPVPAGWRIETGESLFGPYRWACLRHLESQCGLDFYEDSEPMMFAFLMALASPTVTIDGPEAARGDGGEG